MVAKKSNPPVASTLQLTALLNDFRLLLILFIAFRVMLLMVYQPILTQTGERGITTGGDYLYYFNTAALSEKVGMPFQDWWSEFPPVWSHLTTLIYQFQGGARANYTGFAMVVGLLMIVCEAGNLILIRKIGSHLHGANTGMALAWIYALMLAPLVFTFWNFEPLVAFLLLLSLWWLLVKREVHSALVAGIGALTKFTPALIIGAVWRFRERNRALRYSAILVAVFGVVYLLLFIQNSRMTLPSLTSQFNKASYQTVWALIDGNYRTGNFGPLEDRTDPDKAAVVQGNPGRIPGWLRLGIAAAVGIFVFVRTRRFDDRGLVAFVGITLLIFFLQAQGWSPQWLVQIIPLILLCFPTRNGVLITVMLSLVTFAEYPFLFIRTGDTGGEIIGALVMPFAILVLARTALLVGICVALYQKLRQEPVPD
jgi:hypothetical protein